MSKKRGVDLDMDLRRDAEASFGTVSFHTGGILPYEGRALLKRAEGLPPAVFQAQRDGWITPNNPILVRGRATILPLAWRGDAEEDGPEGTGGSGVSGVTAEEIAAFASQLESAGMQWAGNWRVLAELEENHGDSIRSYVDALLASGAKRVSSWTTSETTGIALVRVIDEDTGTMSLALHVVPAAWVSARLAEGPVTGIDVCWSWAEVVELYAARTPGEPPASES